MLLFLQIAFMLTLAAAIANLSIWQYFRGGTWWVAALVGVLAYIAVLSDFFLGSRNAWHAKAIKFLFELVLSSNQRAIASLVILSGITVFLGVLAYQALPADTEYYEVRVYENVDLPRNRHVGAKVTIHSRTDGITHQETVGTDGGAIFRTINTPTVVTYQIEIVNASPAFMIGGNDTITGLPRRLDIDTATIPKEKRQPLPRRIMEPPIGFMPRFDPRRLVPASTQPKPEHRLPVVEMLGDESLQAGNAPWGVPQADLVLNRLGYILGYDLERKLPRWVAYSIWPTEQKVPRLQKFVVDPAISPERQARISDYRASGYDRGHMISPADLYFKGPITVQEAYYLSTITPQTGWLNRKLWRALEVRIRDAVRSQQHVAFVIAGPLYIVPPEESGFKFETIGEGRITVPTHYFRIMAMMTKKGEMRTFGFVAPNRHEGSLDLNNYVRPIRQIELKSGLSFFPLLAPEIAKKIKDEKGVLW